MDKKRVNEIMIQVRNLSKSFGKLHVLKNVNLKLERGENVVILGKSGHGKSVLTKCIVGLIKHDKGSIELFGNDISTMGDEEIDHMRKKLGYLFQGGAIYDSMSVRQNLEFPVKRSRFANEEKAIMDDRIEEVLESVGLLNVIDKMPSELSGGMKKRVGLARTLVLKPEIILYDEPTTGLDPVTSGEISELILNIQQKYQTSSIIITHDMKCARMTANRIKLIVDGEFTAQGTYDELAQHPDEEVRAYFK